MNREIKIGLTEETVFEQRPKISEGISHVGICKKSMPGREEVDVVGICEQQQEGWYSKPVIY